MIGQTVKLSLSSAELGSRLLASADSCRVRKPAAAAAEGSAAGHRAAAASLGAGAGAAAAIAVEVSAAQMHSCGRTTRIQG